MDLILDIANFSNHGPNAKRGQYGYTGVFGWNSLLTQYNAVELHCFSMQIEKIIT